MAEVVDDLDATDLAPHFLTAGDAREGFEAGANGGIIKSGKASSGDGHRSIAHVELTIHGHQEIGAAQLEVRTFRSVADVSDAQVTGCSEADGDDRRL